MANIFVSQTCVAITCEVDVVVGRVLTRMHKCWIYEQVHNEGSMTYVAAIFDQ